MVAAQERERPDQIRGTTTRIRTGCGPLFVTVNDDERGSPFELFATLGKAGGCAAAQTEAIGRLVSLALRSGAPVDTVHSHLRGITCHRPSGFGPTRVLSCGDAIAQVVALRMSSQPEGYVPMVDLQGEGTYAPPSVTLEGDRSAHMPAAAARRPAASGDRLRWVHADAAAHDVGDGHVLRRRVPLLRQQPPGVGGGLPQVHFVRLQRLRLSSCAGGHTTA